MFQRFKTRGYIFKGKNSESICFRLHNTCHCKSEALDKPCAGNPTQMINSLAHMKVELEFSLLSSGYSTLRSFFTKTCLICTKLKPVKYDEFIPLYNGSHHKYILTFPFPTVLIIGRCQLHIMFVHCLIPDISINLRQLQLSSYHI